MKRSSCVAAWMWGTPWASRRTITGADKLPMCRLPSSCGKAAMVTERIQITPRPARRSTRTTMPAMVPSRMRGQRRERRGLRVDFFREPAVKVIGSAIGSRTEYRLARSMLLLRHSEAFAAMLAGEIRRQPAAFELAVFTELHRHIVSED